MPTHRWLGLLVALILLGGCAPLPPAATPAAPSPEETAVPVSGSQGSAVPGGWRTYTNPAGFSIQYPPHWRQIVTSSTPPIYGDALDGPEGLVELLWGEGFGGACAAGYTALHAAQSQLSACHTVSNDGAQSWSAAYTGLSNAGFSVKGLAKEMTPESEELVLAVIATLTFNEGPAANPTPFPGQGQEVVVDNADASFWPNGNWHVWSATSHPDAQMLGEDCYLARPGLEASAEIRPDLAAGSYEVFARWCGDPGATNLSTNGVIEVHRSAKDATPQAVAVNYQAGAGQWQSLGRYSLEPGAYLKVRSVLYGSVAADAYRFVPAPLTGPELVPTPLPTGPIVSNHPPVPWQTLSSGDLATRLTLFDPFLVSVPMTATMQALDDCQAFPRDGCGGTRSAWLADVSYQDIALAYRVSEDYKLVAVEGADALDPWLVGQDDPQLVFLTGSGGGMDYTVHYDTEGTWHLLSGPSLPPSDITVERNKAGILQTLAPKYSTLLLKTPEGGTITFYGWGPTVAPSDEDRAALLALGSDLAAMLR